LLRCSSLELGAAGAPQGVSEWDLSTRSHPTTPREGAGHTGEQVFAQCRGLDWNQYGVKHTKLV